MVTAFIIPDRTTWYRIEAKPDSIWSDRSRWCRKHCQGRWMQIEGTKITEFEDERDAVMFALRWA